MATAAIAPSAAAITTCAPGTGMLGRRAMSPMASTPGTLVCPRTSTITELSSSSVQPGCGAGDRLALGEHDALQRAVLAVKPGDGLLAEPDLVGVQQAAGVVVRPGGAVAAQQHVGAPAGQLQRELEVAGVAGQHRQGLVADLPAVAVGAVEHPAS